MRENLKAATAAIHDRIDHLAGSLPLQSQRHYAAFLRAQYRARSVVEPALARTAPGEFGAPPSQLEALRADLRDLGETARTWDNTLDFESESEAMGAAWVLAGSAMGNRTILSRRKRAGLTTSDRFLSDGAMPRYFKELLQAMDATTDDADIRDAILGAEKTFAVFETCFAEIRPEMAA